MMHHAKQHEGTKQCPEGCEAHGTCNHDTGVCDCPPLMSGPTCELSAVPSCQTQWGLRLPLPPCQALATELEDWRSFPPTCECLAECQALNLRVVYVVDCVNVSQRMYVQGNTGVPKPGEETSRIWRDPFGDGKWLRQAYTPRRRDPPKTELELSKMNLDLATNLGLAAAESKRGGHCSGRGILTTAMPWWRGYESRGKVCHCMPGWYGSDCEYGPGSKGAPVEKGYCVHNCSGRGVCKLNWCHCVPGTWGVDCGLGDPDASLAATSAAEQSRLGLDSPHGWPAAMLKTPRPQLPPSAPALRIFVYELPSRFHTWLAAHFRRAGRWDQSYLYSLDAKLHRWLLRSPYRTLDPEAADVFFIPAYLSLGFYDFEFGLYWLSGRGHRFLQELMYYVATEAGPWYKRNGGRDHVLVMTNDKGATFIRGSVPKLKPVQLITQWGWKRPHIHLPELDIVVPPMLKVDKLISESPFMGAIDTLGGATYEQASSEGYKYLLSFVGSVRFHTPGYSMGVRQKVFRLYNQTERFFLRDLRGDSVKGVHKAMKPKEYLEVLKASKFCLAPSGMGFSTRTYESIAQGCVPLIIQDEPVSNTSVDQAFNSLLPWDEFSYRLTQADIPDLPRLLAEFPDERWRKLRRGLACAWPRVLWLQPDNEAPGMQTEKGVAQRADATAKLGSQAYLSGYDAFESLMHTLARRAARRKGKGELAQFGWRTPATSCKRIAGDGLAVTPPVSAELDSLRALTHGM